MLEATRPNKVDRVGDHPSFGECWICPTNKYNVIAQCKTVENGFLEHKNPDNTLLYLTRKADNITICFTRDDATDHFYKVPIDSIADLLDPKIKFLGNADELINHIHETYGIAGDRMLYTEEQLRRINIASALHISLNHPSDIQLMEMISCNPLSTAR